MMILTEDSLVTAVPVPLVSGLDWKEVTGALVLHFLGKAQKDPEVDVSDCWCISWPWVSHIGQERLKKSGCSRKGSANLNSAQCSGKTTAGCLYLSRTLPQRSAASQQPTIYQQSTDHAFSQRRLPCQAVLLRGTAQGIHLHALDVGSCLDGVWVWNQVRQTWTEVFFFSHTDLKGSLIPCENSLSACLDCVCVFWHHSETISPLTKH